MFHQNFHVGHGMCSIPVQPMHSEDGRAIGGWNVPSSYLNIIFRLKGYLLVMDPHFIWRNQDRQPGGMDRVISAIGGDENVVNKQSFKDQEDQEPSNVSFLWDVQPLEYLIEAETDKTAEYDSNQHPYRDLVTQYAKGESDHATNDRIQEDDLIFFHEVPEIFQGMISRFFSKEAITTVVISTIAEVYNK
jgi:hypothetical protein